MWSTRYSSLILMKIEFSTQILEKYPNIKFHENPSSGGRGVRSVQTDRHDESWEPLSPILLKSLKTVYCDNTTERMNKACRTTCRTPFFHLTMPVLTSDIWNVVATHLFTLGVCETLRPKTDLVIHEWVILLSRGSFCSPLAHTIISYAAARTTVRYGCSSDSSVLVVLCYDENEMGGACSAYGWEERRIYGFGGETWSKESTSETQA